MKAYIDILKQIINDGYDHPDRTGVGRRSIIGPQLRFNLQEGFPLVTTRKIHIKAFIKELLWFIKGDINVSRLNKDDVNIWNKWAVKEEDIDAFIEKHFKAQINTYFENEDEAEEHLSELKDELMSEYLGSIGPMYGFNWRRINIVDPHVKAPPVKLENIPEYKKNIYRLIYSEKVKEFLSEHPDSEYISEETFMLEVEATHCDQLNRLIVGLKEKPYDSRHVVTSWLPEYIPYVDISPQENVLLGKGALAPCHAFFQCVVHPPKENGLPVLNLLMYQRSADFPVGVPFNIAQYALLTHMLAHTCNMEVGELIINYGDAHIYHDQIELAKEQVTREPLSLPSISIRDREQDFFSITYEDICIEGYEHHAPIDYPVAI